MTGPLRTPARLARSLRDFSTDVHDWRTFRAGTPVVVVGRYCPGAVFVEIDDRRLLVRERDLAPLVQADASNRECPP